jgi:biotin carboxyl carrier protein
MKMENVLKAEGAASIKKVLVSSSENVEKNQVLIELDVD